VAPWILGESPFSAGFADRTAGPFVAWGVGTMRSRELALALSLPLLATATLVAGCSADANGAAGATGGPTPREAGETDASRDLPPASDAGDAAADGPPADAAAHDAKAPPPSPPPPPPPIGQIPWQTGPDVGFGIAAKDTENPLGDGIFVGYAGYGVALDAAQAWVTALYESTLRARGIRYLWAVRGPDTPTYANQEIGNSKLVHALLPRVGPLPQPILVAGHSSGSFVAHELLAQLADGMDPGGVTKGRVDYFDLDGGESGLTPASVARLRHAYFVAAQDGATSSPNLATMQSLGATYAAAGGYRLYDAAASGCNAGATWCVHVTLITTRPHDPSNASAALDYSDFAGRPVSHAWLDMAPL
jgi:hypothetical protein